MQRDLDRLMSERQLDAIIVEGPDGLGAANPAFNYFVRGAHLTGIVIKLRNQPALLVHSDWEVLQAAETGLVCVSSSRWNMRDIMQRIPDRLAARVELRRQMLTDLGVSGRVGVYGTVQAGPFLALQRGIEAAMPDLCGRARQRPHQCSTLDQRRARNRRDARRRPKDLRRCSSSSRLYLQCAR